jgi:hypothetical protein
MQHPFHTTQAHPCETPLWQPVIITLGIWEWTDLCQNPNQVPVIAIVILDTACGNYYFPVETALQIFDHDK